MAKSRRQTVTIKDVAREAGVSITTVSNVLNGRTGSMSEETAHRVLDVMAALHNVDHVAVGLERFGRPDGYLARQTSRWADQLLDTCKMARSPDPYLRGFFKGTTCCLSAS